MTQTYTSNDLIRFLYRETTASETLRIERALESNLALRAEYELLRDGRRVYPQVKFNAKASTLAAVLRYSQKTALEASF